MWRIRRCPAFDHISLGIRNLQFCPRKFLTSDQIFFTDRYFIIFWCFRYILLTPCFYSQIVGGEETILILVIRFFCITVGSPCPEVYAGDIIQLLCNRIDSSQEPIQSFAGPYLHRVICPFRTFLVCIKYYLFDLICILEIYRLNLIID